MILILPRINELHTQDHHHHHQQDNSLLLYYCGIYAFIYVSILSWKVYQSCRELEEIQAAIDGLDTFRCTFREFVKGYFLRGVWIDMSKRRHCSYCQHHHNKEQNITLGWSIPSQKNADGASFVSMPTELRGITLRDLRAIFANVVRRCEQERWVNKDGQPVTPETANLYDIMEYIILPFTEKSQKSFVETQPSTAGAQPPRIFISHRYATPFKDTIACIEQMIEDFKWNRDNDDDARGGGMTEDTPLWICAFANNPRNFGDEIKTSNLNESSVIKAMNTCHFRTMSILDTNCMYFTRVWAMIAIFMTLKKRGLWAIYTATADKYPLPKLREERSAIGIVPGGAPGEAADDTFIREEFFPPDLILRSFQFKVECAQAFDETDRVNILNFLRTNKNGINASPASTDDGYTELEDAVRGAFAASVPALKVALAAPNREEWKKMLDALSKGIRTDVFKLDFRAFDNPPLSSVQAHELVSHIPPTYTGLLFTNAIRETAVGMIGGMIEWVANAKEIKELICFDVKVCDSKEGRRLGSQLANELTESSCAESIEHFYMTNTDLVVPGNITQWATALKQMKSLKILYFHGIQISEEDKRILRDATLAVTYFKK